MKSFKVGDRVVIRTSRAYLKQFDGIVGTISEIEDGVVAFLTFDKGSLSGIPFRAPHRWRLSYLVPVDDEDQEDALIARLDPEVLRRTEARLGKVKAERDTLASVLDYALGLLDESGRARVFGFWDGVS